MILQRLYQLAERERLLDDPAFVRIPIQCVVTIARDGSYLGLIDVRQREEVAGKRGGPPKIRVTGGRSLLVPVRPVQWDKKQTKWKTNDLWLRRDFEWSGDKPLHELGLRIHHDEDTEVYLNGILIGTASGYSTQYHDRALDADATRALKPGKNVLAVHCHQTGGGQYIDVGLVDIEEVSK